MVLRRQVSVGIRAQALVSKPDCWSQLEYEKPWTMHLPVRSMLASNVPNDLRNRQMHPQGHKILRATLTGIIVPLTVGDEGLPLGLEQQDDEDDPDYYSSTPLSPSVQEFMETSFSKCVPRMKRQRLALEYPRPDVQGTKVPKLGTIFRSALGRNVTYKSDDQLAKVQTTVLAACSPIANLWSHLDR